MRESRTASALRAAVRATRGCMPLLLGVLLVPAAGAEAAVDPVPRAPRITLTGSADFPEIAFVLYRLKAGYPWRAGMQLEPGQTLVLETDMSVEPILEGTYVVLGIPQALAKKSNGNADPAWLEPSAPGVIRVPEPYAVPSVFRPVVLRYQVEKGERGPQLRLLNPEDLRVAANPQPPRPSVPRSEASAPPIPTYVWAGGAGALVLIAAFFVLRRVRRVRRDRQTPGGLRV